MFGALSRMIMARRKGDGQAIGFLTQGPSSIQIRSTVSMKVAC